MSTEILEGIKQVSAQTDSRTPWYAKVVFLVDERTGNAPGRVHICIEQSMNKDASGYVNKRGMDTPYCGFNKSIFHEAVALEPGEGMIYNEQAICKTCLKRYAANQTQHIPSE